MTREGRGMTESEHGNDPALGCHPREGGGPGGGAAGCFCKVRKEEKGWIPACAKMTKEGRESGKRGWVE